MIAIIDYGMGNLRSVQKGFEKAGWSARIVQSAGEVLAAKGVVLPG
ncbi:MAG: imidazole glycerol phosphate synthase subunit HisH, partial [Bacillota bacterium]